MLGCKGMGAQKAAWIEAFGAEASTAGGLAHTATLMDLVKAFDRIPQGLLVREAVALAYPLKMLRLSIAIYRMNRTIRVAGAC